MTSHVCAQAPQQYAYSVGYPQILNGLSRSCWYSNSFR